MQYTVGDIMFERHVDKGRCHTLHLHDIEIFKKAAALHNHIRLTLPHRAGRFAEIEFNVVHARVDSHGNVNGFGIRSPGATAIGT